MASAAPTGYDADGNVLTVTDPDGNTVSNPDIAGHTTTNTYNLLDRKLTAAVPRSDTLFETTTYGYDPAGNTLFTDAPGNGSSRRRTLTAYDADNRAVDTVTGADNDASASVGMPSAATQVNLRSRNFYDADGNVMATLDPRAMDGHTTGGVTYTPTNPDFSYLDYTDHDVDGRTTATYVNRPGLRGGSDPTEAVDHGCTAEVPERVA